MLQKIIVWISRMRTTWSSSWCWSVFSSVLIVLYVIQVLPFSSWWLLPVVICF